MLRFGYHISSIHHGQKDHKCDLCEKEFSHVGTLRKHISEVHSSIHHGQKNHRYDLCEKEFSRAGTLRKHISEVPNGKKNHKCD